MPYTIENFQHSPHVIPDATEESAGVMSAADKRKLDSLSPGGGTLRFTYTIKPGDGNQFTVTLPFVPPASPYGAWAQGYAVSDFVTYYVPGGLRGPTSVQVITSGALTSGDVIEIYVTP